MYKFEVTRQWVRIYRPDGELFLRLYLSPNNKKQVLDNARLTVHALNYWVQNMEP